MASFVILFLACTFQGVGLARSDEYCGKTRCNCSEVVPANPKNGTVEVFRNGTDAFYYCNKGYMSVGDAKLICIKDKGTLKWRSSYHSCNPIGNDTGGTSITTDTTATMSTTETSTPMKADDTSTTTDSTTGTSGDFKETKASDESSSPGVYVSIVAIIVVAAGIVVLIFFLRRRNDSVLIDSPGSSLTNATYAEPAANIQTSQSLDSGYAEIPIDNFKENLDSEYQTIDSLPEDQMTNSNAYGHLQERKRQFENGNYSHMTYNQENGVKQKSANMNYSHIDNEGNILHDMVSLANTDNTYNTTDTKSRLNENGNGNTDPEEVEYDHAKAGHSEANSEMKVTGEYAHLDSTGKNIHAREGTKDQMNTSIKDAKNAAPLYSKADKTNASSECPHQTANNYEIAVGIPHEYLTLQPQTENTDDKNVNSFRVVENEMNNTSENSECGEGNHDYFILEKSTT